MPTPTREDLDKLSRDILELKKKRVELMQQLPPEPVKDYDLQTLGGPVKLSALFGASPDLILIHNMGRSCRWCTLWADGFVSIHNHLTSRCPFVLSSPDDPQVQAEFAKSRGWPFTMVSVKGSTFAKDMGFEKAAGDFWPGVSVFHKDASGNITRTGHDNFGPGDDFCSVWHLFDLLKSGVGDWEPQYRYA